MKVLNFGEVTMNVVCVQIKKRSKKYNISFGRINFGHELVGKHNFSVRCLLKQMKNSRNPQFLLLTKILSHTFRRFRGISFFEYFQHLSPHEGLGPLRNFFRRGIKIIDIFNPCACTDYNSKTSL